MASPKKLYHAKKTKDAILTGIYEATELTAVTLGPKGKLVVVAKGSDPRTTKDGISVIKEIGFSDPLMNVGAQLVREASHKVAYLAGDGTTSTAILVEKFCEAANKLCSQGADATEIKRGFEIARDATLEQLKSYVEKITNDDDIRHVAKVSANGDDEIADMVLEAFKGIGDDGVVTLADSMSRKGLTDVAFSSGLELESGYASQLFANSRGDACEFTDPVFLLCWKPVTEFETISPWIEKAHRDGESLVIIAPDFSDEVISICATNAAKKTVSVCLVFGPGNQKTDREDLLRDVAAILGAEILGETKAPEEWKHETDMGHCEHVLITRNKTIFGGARHDEKKFETYLQSLRDSINSDDSSEAKSEYEIEKIKQRLAHLSGGIATIRVGGLTTQELQEKKDRYEDAICAVRAAMGEGIIPGAGVPLLKISKLVSGLIVEGGTLAMSAAFREYGSALKEIAWRLIGSCGADPYEAIPALMCDSKKICFDARDGRVIEDAFATGIIDPYKVVRLAVLYATGVALTYLQIGGGITHDAPNLTMDRIDPLVEPTEGMLDEYK